MKKSLFMLMLIAAVGLIMVVRVTAQTFTVLHSFTTDSTSGHDGAFPVGLVLSGNILYGATSWDNGPGVGTVFKVGTDGTGFATLHSFAAGAVDPFNRYTNSDGANPNAGLIVSGSVLYGVTFYGGSSGYGTVFKLNRDGTGFTSLHSFSGGSDDGNPRAGVVLSGNTLYGTTCLEGGSSGGSVFKLNTNGTGFANLHTFSNIDGAGPLAALTCSGNRLYGTTEDGGSSDSGTVFVVNTDSTDFTLLHDFSAGLGPMFGPATNSDGLHPHATLLLSGNTLYGTTELGGGLGAGNVFAVNTDGTGFTNLHSFRRGSDGGFPQAGLVLCNGSLCGTTADWGDGGWGTIFTVETNGTDFITQHGFGGDGDGGSPRADLVLLGHTLYGVASQGGDPQNGGGVVFSISFSPQLQMARSEASITLMWPSNYAGFDYTGYTLQSTTNLTSPVWTTNLPAPLVVNGQYTVTNPISGTQQFFRLSQ
jgi:uncharacterized repeat protein (TIGR03803 family)